MKLRFILLLCLCFLLLFFFQSISFGANGGVFVETTYKGNGKAIITAIIDNYFNGGETNNASYLNTESAIFHAIEQPYTSISLQFKKGTGTYWTNYLNVAISNTSFTFTEGGNRLTEVHPYTNYQLSNYRNSLTGSLTNQSSDLQISLNNLGTTDDLVAVYNSNYSNKWYQNSISAIHIGDYKESPNITFSPSALATLTSYNNYDVYLYRISRSVNYWNLGSLSSNFKEAEQLNISLSPLQWVSGDSSISDGTYATSVYYHNGTILNNNKLVLGSNGFVSIPNYYVYYNNLYNFTIYYRYDGVDYDLNFPMYFKQVGEDTTINSLINQDANTGLDIDFINSLDQYFDNQTTSNSGDISALMSNWFKFSGDFYSGDLAYDMGFNYTETRWNSFIFNIYNNIINRIMNPSSNPSITFNLRGRNFTYYANDFTIPNNSLKSFVSVVLTAGFVILFVQQIHLIILNIQTLNLFGTLKSIENKHTFFM